MKNWMSSLKENTSYKALTSVWVIAQLSVMAIVLPMLTIFPEYNVALIVIQIVCAIVILVVQRISHYRMLQKCIECGKTFHCPNWVPAPLHERCNKCNINKPQ